MIFANLSKREKIFAFMTVTLIAGFLLYTQGVERIVKKWSNLSNAISAKSVKLKKDIKLLSRKESIEMEYKNYLASIKTGLSEEEEAASSLSDIETVAKKDSFFIINVKPSQTKDMGFYKEIVFEISAESAASELIKFIYDIKALKKLLKVKKFTLSSKVTQQNKLKISLLISKILIK